MAVVGPADTAAVVVVVDAVELRMQVGVAELVHIVDVDKEKNHQWRC